VAQGIWSFDTSIRYVDTVTADWRRDRGRLVLVAYHEQRPGSAKSLQEILDAFAVESWMSRNCSGTLRRGAPGWKHVQPPRR
jgi:hypothetical protein